MIIDNTAPTVASITPGTSSPTSSDSVSFSVVFNEAVAGFDSFADFAQATLPELFSAETLDTAIRLEANTLASGVFMNDGQGKFTFSELPRHAQIAPVYGIVAQDFNGDGFNLFGGEFPHEGGGILDG